MKTANRQEEARRQLRRAPATLYDPFDRPGRQETFPAPLAFPNAFRNGAGVIFETLRRVMASADYSAASRIAQ